MNDTLRRRFLDHMGSAPSLLAPGSAYAGEIRTPGPLLVSGHVQGNGQIGGELSLSPEASWEGELIAHSAVIAGRLTGILSVTDKLEIAATAVIRGRITARRIAMARGATVEAEITVTGNEPVVEFEEKRTSR